MPLDTVLQKLSEFAPLRLAESWDNVGLLVGARHAKVERVMTCLTITPAVVQEAVQRRVGLIVAHHPLPFKPLSRVTSDSTTGRMLLDLIAAGVAVYSSHTAFDSAVGGINAMWAERLKLTKIRALEPLPESLDETLGSGRFGLLPAPLEIDLFAELVKGAVDAPACRVVRAMVAPLSSTDQGASEDLLRTDVLLSVVKVSIACGSGGSLLAAAKRRGCDAFVTGEATFHTCLEAQASGIHLFLVGHFHSERFAMAQLADRLGRELSDLDVFASVCDLDPVQDRF